MRTRFLGLLAMAATTAAMFVARSAFAERATSSGGSYSSELLADVTTPADLSPDEIPSGGWEAALAETWPRSNNLDGVLMSDVWIRTADAQRVLAEPQTYHPLAAMPVPEDYFDEEPPPRGFLSKLFFRRYDEVAVGNWYDVHAEYLNWTRYEVARRQEFTSSGLAGTRVLTTDNLEFDQESGFRVTLSLDYALARLGVAPLLGGKNAELSYFGTLHWAESAKAHSDADMLYSIFSGFGTPPFFGGFLETDQASRHIIEYSSDLDNVELNVREQWMLPNRKVSGSFLAGLRYVRLDEDFRYVTEVDAHVDPLTALARGPGSMDYRVKTENDLFGFQLGSETFVMVLPGLQLGAEAEAGVFVNHGQQTTTIALSSGAMTEEFASQQDVAFVGEGSLIATYEFSNHVTARMAYTVLYIDGVALAIDNFNASPPQLNRNAVYKDDGVVFLHGVSGGVELTW